MPARLPHARTTSTDSPGLRDASRHTQRTLALVALLVTALAAHGCGSALEPGSDAATDAPRSDGQPDADPLPDDDDASLPEDDADLGDPDASGIENDASVPVQTDAGTHPDAATAPACTRHTYRLRHLQSSQQRTDTEARRNASIDAAFAAGAQSISWTEIENLSDVRHINAHAGWDTFWPSGHVELVARNAVPVSWRADTFRLVRGASYFASGGLAGVSPSRWVTRVWLRHIASGQIVSRVAHHSVSGVDGGGSPPVAWRQRAHAADLAKFSDVMHLDHVPVIGSGDFNTTRLRGLLGSGFAYDVPSSGGSHGARLIDWIVRVPDAQQRLVEVHFVTVGSSDHRGVMATYDYTPACP